MSDINNQGFELDWDSEIEKDGQEYITLPGGSISIHSYELRARPI